jgi:SAM-dependent methyltransferase
MHWRIKALIQKTCAVVPFGDALYYQFQRRLGNLRDPDFARKLSYHRSLARTVARHGVPLTGARILEVGTGWMPLMPLGFWICGARSVLTVDLNRYLSKGLTRQLLGWMADHRDELVEMWSEVAPRSIVTERLDYAIAMRDRPFELMEAASIEYRAPYDAGRTGLPGGSIDLHFSYNVFEHVPPGGLRAILAEGRRVLRPGGLTIHYADPTDHFSHSDRRLLKIDFLRYEPETWRTIAGNAYAYTNRLRDSDFRPLFAEQGLRLVETRYDVDKVSFDAVRAGFPLASPFRDRDPEDLCRHNLVYVAVEPD